MPADNSQGSAEGGPLRQLLLSPEMANEVAVLIAQALDDRDRRRQQHRRSFIADNPNRNNENNSTNANNCTQGQSLGYSLGTNPNQVSTSGVSLRWNPEDIGFFEPGNSDGEDYNY
jgi:hypothetical protein